ncbi:cystathionine gamma-synthase [Kangiella sediminilitoris]|uniref:Cystathionine gamma-synthase n=1 Tax=Kangiella sediminilitoris TaxID=1144748 RepID=A0A1B3BB79_9GAMM|nr:cystathionine gamma-synthase [Kangiella sediminilitoris]AOE50053.1 cystathionine gamma-synthase [Kangiella sediminilitoris]
MSHQQATQAVRAGIETDEQYGAVTPPLYLSSNYTFENLGSPRKYDYSRSGNPTRDVLADCLADLENGAGAVVTSSGMSAVHLVTQLLQPSDLVLVPHDCYGGTYRLFTSLANKGGCRVKFVDQGDSETFAAALTEKPRMLWMETPSNPLLRIVDIVQLCEQAGDDVIKVVDNTFLSPIQQKPLDLGADLVIHSTTKYINGHSDVVGGAVIAKAEGLYEQIAWWANCIGITASPFDSFITTRGIRTLGIRIKKHEENAQSIAEYLDKNCLVENVYYPGLEYHPGHLIARKQQTGFGAMLSFTTKFDQETLAIFIKSLKLFSLAESLGGVESLICHPATMTHAAMDKSAQLEAGITPQLLRVSVGIEELEDLLSDLKQAFDFVENKLGNLQQEVSNG